MARIRGRDTRPELAVRRALFAMGFRYRLHGAGLPGRPDLVFPGLRAVIFVHGCYWHGHGCHMFRFPAGNAKFWRKKIEGNAARDERDRSALLEGEWRVMTVWECALRGKAKIGIEAVAAECALWLRSHEAVSTIEGRPV